MKYTKSELKQAVLMILKEFLPNKKCEKIIKQGNFECDRCDICMLEQYIQKVKDISYSDKQKNRRCKECDEIIKYDYCNCERSYKIGG